MHVLSLGHRHTVCMDARGRVDVHPTYRKLPSESIAAPRPNRGLMRPFGILGCVIIYDAALSPAHIDKLINKPVQNIGLGTRIYIYIYIYPSVHLDLVDRSSGLPRVKTKEWMVVVKWR